MHPYTEALLASVPTLEPREGERIRLERHIGSADKESAGCIFAARCPRVIAGLCQSVAPPWQQVRARRYLCHHAPAELEKILPELIGGATPRSIREHLQLNRPIYARTAAYGHFGRTPDNEGGFSWERTDLAAALKSLA